MQSRHVLLQSVGLNVAHRFLRHRSANHELAILIFFRKGEIGLTVTENIHSRFKILLIAERDFKCVADTDNTGMTDLMVTKQCSDFAGRSFNAFCHGRLHVYGEQKVHTAAKVKTEIHRKRVDLKQPSRSIRNEVKRDDIRRIGRIRIQCFFKHVAGTELKFAVCRSKTYANRVLLSALLKENAVGFDLSGGKCVFNRL